MKLLAVVRLLAKIVLALAGVGGAVVASQLVPGCGREPLGRTALVAVPAGGAGWETGRVVRVIDGDTYEVLAGAAVVRVRLLGVDAPEHDQAFGAQATDSVGRLVAGQLVRLQRRGTDLYGRTLGAVRLVGGASVDSLLVVRGWAWAFDLNRTVAGRAAQQTAAQRAGRGLWKCGIIGVVPPKLWRSFNAQNKRRYRGACPR